MADQLTDIYKEFESGRLLRFGQKNMVKGFNLTGLFPFEKVPTKKVNVITSTPIDKFVDKTGKQRKMAKGARVRQIKGEVETAGGLSLVHNEIEYVIENEDMNRPEFNVYDELKAMVYILSMDVEELVTKVARENAAISIPSGVTLNDNWDDSGTSLEHIIGDILEMQATSFDTLYTLNWFAQGKRANVEFGKRVLQSVEDYTLPQNQFVIENVANFMNARHFYGGRYMNDGEIIAGDFNNPGLKVFFKDYTNPNVKSAPMPKGLEQLAPPMKMLMYDNSDKESEPQTTIKVACAAGAYPIRKGEGLFRYADITSTA